MADEIERWNGKVKQWLEEMKSPDYLEKPDPSLLAVAMSAMAVAMRDIEKE